MEWLLIENKGEISIDALILMGGTSKRGDKSKIGMYGSGNKYSIATLLNAGIPFRVFSGLEEINITCEPYDFRGVELKKIYVNGKETQLTTSMGPEWEAWMAVREWCSNAIDEGGMTVVPKVIDVNPKEGYTRFFIAVTDQIKEVVDDWDNYFTFDRTDLIVEREGDKLFTQTSPENARIFYRMGIRCEYNKLIKTLYQYDLKNIEINESRVMKNEYQANNQIIKFLNSIEDERVIKNILKNAYTGKYYENCLDWDSWFISKLSPTFRKAIGDHRIVVGDLGGWFLEEQKTYDCYVVSDSLAKAVKKAFPEVVVYGLLDDGKQIVQKKKVELSKRMTFLLNEVKRFFTEAEYSIEYPIEVVSFTSNEEMLGLAEDGIIYISDKQFEKGKKEIAVTIMEENEHLKTKYKDCSRAFQNHIFNIALSQMEERIAHFL